MLDVDERDLQNLKDVFQVQEQHSSVLNPEPDQISDHKCKFVSPSLFLVNETPKNRKRDSKKKDKHSDHENEDSFIKPLICSEMFGKSNLSFDSKSIQTNQFQVRDAQMQTSPQQQQINSSRFLTPNRAGNSGLGSNSTQTILTGYQRERISRLLKTPEIFTPKITYRSPTQRFTFPKPAINCDERAQIIGRDEYHNLHHLEISHKKLDEMYRDILPFRYAETLS